MKISSQKFERNVLWITSQAVACMMLKSYGTRKFVVNLWLSTFFWKDGHITGTRNISGFVLRNDTLVISH